MSSNNRERGASSGWSRAIWCSRAVQHSRLEYEPWREVRTRMRAAAQVLLAPLVW